MNTKRLVKITNIIGLISFILLIYWIFVFILVQVFNLKIFRQHMTEIFGLSIFGIIALMAGTLMLNIMLNLTRIAERNEHQENQRNGKKIGWLLLAVFPILAGLLFMGNRFSIHKKEELLWQSAHAIIHRYPKQTDFMAHYQFTPEYARQTAEHLRLMNKLDTSIHDITVLVPDYIDDKSVYLAFDENSFRVRLDENKKQIFEKQDFIFSLNASERQYLDQTFQQNLSNPKLVRQDNHYHLYYPHQINDKTVIVFLLSDYYRYGKIGS